MAFTRRLAPDTALAELPLAAETRTDALVKGKATFQLGSGEARRLATVQVRPIRT